MGKYLIMYCLIFGTINPLIAQNKHSAEINSAVSFISNNYRGIVNPSYTLGRKNHAFSLGPVFQIYTNSGQNHHSKPWWSGFKGTYRYFPQLSHKSIAFFFKYDLIYQHIIDAYQTNAFNPRLGVYQDYDYQNSEDIFETYVGYGVQFKFKKMFLIQNVGAGIYYSTIGDNVVASEAPGLADFDFRGYGNFGFSWNVQLGVGYDF